jgi:hypothetical protein
VRLIADVLERRLAQRDRLDLGVVVCIMIVIVVRRRLGGCRFRLNLRAASNVPKRSACQKD